MMRLCSLFVLVLLVACSTTPEDNEGAGRKAAETNTALLSAPGSGLHLYITDIVVTALTAQTIKFVEDTGGTPVDVVEILYVGANGLHQINFNQPLRLSENVDFGFTSTATVATSVTVSGYIAP